MKLAYYIIFLVFSQYSVFSQKLDLTEIFQQHEEFTLKRYLDIDFVNKDTFMVKAGWFNSTEDYTQLQITYNKGKKFSGKKGPNGPWGAWVGTNIYIANGGTKWGLQMSTDTGATWDSVTTAPVVANHISNPSAYKHAVFISFDWETYVSYDTLKTWTKCNSPTYFAGAEWEYTSDSSLIILLSGTKNDPIAKLESKDFGIKWKQTKLGVKQKFRNTIGFLTPKVCYYTNRNTQHLYWSYDSGFSFKDSIYIDIDDFEFENAIAFANERIGYFVVNGFDLYKTYNGGKSWELKHTFAPDEPIFEIKVFDSVNVFFLSYGGTTKNVIYYTENGLETIVNATAPQGHTYHLYPNPANQSITLSTSNGQNAQLSIYNLMGQVQYHNPSQAPGSIDISHLATGLYIFELRQGATVHRQRIEVVK